MTKPWFWNLLLVLALLLAGTELLSSLSGSPPTLPVPPEVSGRSDPLPAVRPPAPVTAYAEIADRNLFSAGRGQADPLPEAQPTPAAAKAALPPPKATLFGIVVDDGGEKYAYLTDDSSPRKDKAKRYREGDDFAGATINEIHFDRVIMSSGGTKHTFALRAPKTGLEAYRPPAPPRRSVAPRPPGTQRSAAEVRSRRRQAEEARRSNRSSVRRRRLERLEEGLDDQDDPFREDGGLEEERYIDDPGGEYGEFDEEEGEW